jgi:ABC-type branched-subunit amino acid transport system ATPase component
MPPYASSSAPEATSSDRAILEIRDVSQRFGGVRALTNMSFCVSPRSVTSVIGPNGAGKTTMFNIVSGLQKPTLGRVFFKGVDITGWAPHRIVPLGMARTFQNLQLFDTLNAIENVMAVRYCRSRSGVFDAAFWLPRDRADRRRMREVAEEWLQWVGLWDQRFMMPSELPYGDQRRLEIARALATEPDFLMLDEPTAGMIAREAQVCMDLVQRLVELNKTVLLIEHNMGLVMSVSDQVIVFNFGEKLAEGPPNHVRNNPEVIAAYLGSDET